jgi:hypothetical protein
MKYFLDTEFIEYPGIIDLISIGLVSEDNRHYYAINKDCNFKKANDWVRQNVLATLPPYNPMPTECSPSTWEASKAWKSREDIKIELSDFMGVTYDFDPYIREGWMGLYDVVFRRKVIYENFRLKIHVKSPEIWGEWCSYDWVCFAQLFGTMSDLPQGFPMRCRDIIQLAEDQLGIPAIQLPPSLETEGNHNALLGAKTVKMRYEWLINKAKQTGEQK